MTTVTLANADRLQHVAVSRLTLYVAGRVHALLYPAQAALVGAVREAAGPDGMADAAKLGEAVRGFEPKWRQFIAGYTGLLQNARIAAGSIAFAPWRLRHNSRFPQPVERMQEAFVPTSTDYLQMIEMWVRRRNYALQVAQQRVYSDGLNLSQRIWRLDNGGMSQIRGTIAGAMAERTSAWDLAARLEGQLNADQDWPKWSETRLRNMDARARLLSKDGLWRNAAEMRAGNPDVTGLLTPPAGISYNALRLARNEIQAANHAVTSDIAQHFPGITGRKVVLSPAHPQSDVCDELAAGGPYDKTANFLPAHPQCVTPGQLIWTKRGQIPVESVQVSDEVLTHEGRFCPVTAAWSSYHNDRVYTIETDRGQIEVTSNHPVLLMRGWVNAENVQPGDQILYASSGVLSDLASGVAEDTPALFGEPSITGSVSGGGAFVPTNAVNLDPHSASDEGEVKEVTPDLMLSFVDQAGNVQSINHGQLCAGGVVEAHLPVPQEHGHEAGIVGFLGGGNLAANVGACGGVAKVQSVPLDGVAHFRAGTCSPAAIVLAPLVGNRFAVRAQRDTVGDQQLSEATIGDSVPFVNLRGAESLNHIDLAQEVGNGLAGFGFDSQGLELCGAYVVLDEVRTRPTAHLQPADGASDGHDNLLLLSPDLPWGAGSGNPVVRGVITPSRALLHYTTVRAIRVRQYTGPVYNMTVQGDNSYTVGGHVVHNCLCRWEEVLMPAKDFAAQVGGWVRGENDFLDDYGSWLGTRSFAPLPDVLTVAAEVTQMMQNWLEGDVDTAAQVLRF